MIKDLDNLDKEERELYELLANNLTEEQLVRALELIAIDCDKYHQEQLNKGGVIQLVSTRDFESDCSIDIDPNLDMFVFKYKGEERARSKSRFEVLIEKKKLQKELGA